MYNRDEVQHEISLQEASQLTTRFQENLLPGQPKGSFFGKQALQRLLDHPECVGLRCFFGANNEGMRVMVMMNSAWIYLKGRHSICQSPAHPSAAHPIF